MKRSVLPRHPQPHSAPSWDDGSLAVRVTFLLLSYGGPQLLLCPRSPLFVCWDETLISERSPAPSPGEPKHRTAFTPPDSLWGWRSPGTGCPGRLWSLLLWRYSSPAWTRSCAACCRWPCFGRGVGLDDPQSSLPTLNILWFCDASPYVKRDAGFGLCSLQCSLWAVPRWDLHFLLLV